MSWYYRKTMLIVRSRTGLFSIWIRPFLRESRCSKKPAVGGAVLNRFVSDHVGGMDRYTCRHMVLLIDFDGSREVENR
jgi:hypothetical protein